MPPTRGSSATPSAGWTQKSVTPASASPTPSAKSVSVSDGTSETIRRGGVRERVLAAERVSDAHGRAVA